MNISVNLILNPISFLLLATLQTDAVDVDIDEILDMDNDDIRRSHLAVIKSFGISPNQLVKLISLSTFSDFYRSPLDRSLTYR